MDHRGAIVADLVHSRIHGSSGTATGSSWAVGVVGVNGMINPRGPGGVRPSSLCGGQGAFKGEGGEKKQGTRLGLPCFFFPSSFFLSPSLSLMMLIYVPITCNVGDVWLGMRWY